MSLNNEYIVTSKPSNLPVSLNDVKRHLYLPISKTIPVLSLVSTGFDATLVTSVPHGLSSGETVTISGANESEYNLTAQIIVVNDTELTYELEELASGSPASGTIILTTNTDQDVYLTQLILAAAETFEKYTKLTLIRTGYRAFRNSFCASFIQLRRGPLLELASIQYLLDSVPQSLDLSDVFATESNTFAKIYPAKGNEFPVSDNFPQSVQIDFFAGFGDTSDDIPADVKIGMLNHIAAMYTDRGDCDDCSCDALLPKQSMLIYDLYRVIDIWIDESFGRGNPVIPSIWGW